MGGIINSITGGTNEYQASTTPGFSDALMNSNNNYNQTYAQQQELNNMLRNQATNGSTLAQSQLDAATGQNIANQAGLVQSQKGLNPALAARLAGQNATQANQMAGNQAAQLKAQTQMAAMSGLGQNLGTQGSQALNYQGILQGANTSNNQINAGVAANNATNAAAVTGGILGGAAGVMGKSEGGHIPGEAVVPGDSEKNDTVPTMLSPGEIVIPRSKAGDPEKAKDFIDHLMKSKKMSKGGKVEYGDVLAAQRKLADRLAKLESRLGSKNGR